MRKQCSLLFFHFILLLSRHAAITSSLSTMNPVASKVSHKIPNVAVIGGGAAGLAAARALSRHIDGVAAMHRPTVTVFEKEDDIVGVWNYKPSSTVTPMYRGLRTNLPKEIMAFREYPFEATVDRSFVTHQEVAEYLRHYCDKFDLRQYVRTNCKIDKLTCLKETRSLVSPTTEDWPKVELQWKNVLDDSQGSDIFDAVYICNGHYSRPAFPTLPGLQEYFKGRTLHSIAYDVPAEFSGKTVLCVGGRASGSDLAREISQVKGTKVYLSDTTFALQESTTMHDVTLVPKTAQITPNGNVAFDSTVAHVEPIHVDVIIFCSGYHYDFPFVKDDSNLDLETENRRVKPLYEQLWHSVYPNIAFVGIPHSVIPFPLFELQAEAVEVSWRVDGALPELKQRHSAALKAAESGGEGKPEGRIPEDTHFLGSAQWNYCLRMARYAGFDDGVLDAYVATNKALWDHTGAERKNSLPGSPDLYRKTVYARDFTSQSFDVVQSLADGEGTRSDAASAA